MEKQRILKIIEEALLQYGFIILPTEYATDFVEYLRYCNILQFFRISKSENYIVIELNTLPCEYECNMQCHNNNGYRNDACYFSCVYSCKEYKLNAILSKIRTLQ